jgi:peptidoglycan/LPS O-acetylase OafA/YrhL
MAVALLAPRLPVGRRGWFLLPIGVALMSWGFANPLVWSSLDLPGGLGSGFLVAWAVATRPTFHTLAPVVSAGAAMSYSIYLWHGDLIRAIPSAPVALAATCLVAAVVYAGIERPILQRARRWRRPERLVSATMPAGPALAPEAAS